MDNKLSLMVSFIGIDKLSGSMRNIIGLGKTGGQALKGMKDQARGLERELRGVQNQIRNSSGNVSGLVNREKELKASIAATNAQLERRKRLMAIDARAMAMAAKGEAHKSAGRDQMMGGVAMLLPFIAATKQAGDFQDGMIDIALKANMTRRETALMSKQIMKAAIAAKQLPENMRMGLDVLAGFGMDPRMGVKMLAPIGQAATAYRAEIADLASVSYSNFQNLRVPINQNARALEIMASAGKSGAFELRDMAQYFPALTGYAQALGQTGVGAVADLSAALQIARITAKDSAVAATNVENLLAKIQSKATVDKFAKFGVDLPAALKKAYKEGKTPLEAIAAIASKTVNGDLSRLSYLFEDMQAQNALRPLIQNMELYRKIRADAMASRGAVAADFARRSEGANTNGRLLLANMQRIAVVAGSALLPPLVALSGKLVNLATGFANWAEKNPALASTLIQVVAGAAMLKIGLGALRFMFGGLLGPMSTAFKYFMRFRAWGGVTRIVMGSVALWQRMGPMFTMLGSVGGRALGLLSRGGMMAGRAVLFLGRAFLMNPIGLAVTALGVAAYLIYTHWGKIRAAFFAAVAWLGQAWAAIKAAFMTGVSYIIGLHGRMLGIGKNIIMGLARGIMAAGGAVWNALKGVVMSGIGKITKFLGIKSPSRLFMEMGGHMAHGMALGIDKGGKRVLRSAGRLAAGAAAASALTMPSAFAKPPQGGKAQVSFGQASPALGSAPQFIARGPRGPGDAPAVYHVTIRIDGAGKSAKEIADEVKRELEKLEGTKNRRTFDDGE